MRSIFDKGRFVRKLSARHTHTHTQTHKLPILYKVVSIVAGKDIASYK